MQDVCNEGLICAAAFLLLKPLLMLADTLAPALDKIESLKKSKSTRNSPEKTSSTGTKLKHLWFFLYKCVYVNSKNRLCLKQVFCGCTPSSFLPFFADGVVLFCFCFWKKKSVVLFYSAKPVPQHFLGLTAFVVFLKKKILSETACLVSFGVNVSSKKSKNSSKKKSESL